jgi:hypothetical protein
MVRAEAGMGVEEITEHCLQNVHCSQKETHAYVEQVTPAAVAVLCSLRLIRHKRIPPRHGGSTQPVQRMDWPPYGAERPATLLVNQSASGGVE